MREFRQLLFARLDIRELSDIQFRCEDFLAELSGQVNRSRFNALRLRCLDDDLHCNVVRKVINIQNDVVVCGIAPIPAIESA